LGAGADDFVTKPINSEILRARIETQLRLGSMRRQLESQNEQLESWRRNLERDLEAARLTQQSLIPQKPLQLRGWEIATCFRPVIQVGGDIYGWLPMKDGRVLFWIADAAGHGASAALLTTLTKLLFHHGSAENGTPTEIMQAVLQDFHGIFGSHLFMTAMCLALDPATGSAAVVGAGHPPLLILRKKSQPELIWSNAPPLGLAKRDQVVETSIDLGVGDGFVLYTDGLFGGGPNQDSRLTPDKLAAMIESLCPNVETLLEKILPEPAVKPNGEKISDDIAAVAARRTR
jgi:sigma-B regulation protein RsbU (phosphoserine phosphatase)